VGLSLFMILRVSWLSLHKYFAIAVGFIISASNLRFCSCFECHFRSTLFQLLHYYIPFLRSSLLSSAREYIC